MIVKPGKREPLASRYTSDTPSLATPICPRCGAVATHTVDDCVVHQPIYVEPDGTFTWADDHEDFDDWEGAETRTDAKGAPLLRCEPCGHEWYDGEGEVQSYEDEPPQVRDLTDEGLLNLRRIVEATVTKRGLA